eukprot:7146107-Prymnesium_polylepis.1
MATAGHEETSARIPTHCTLVALMNYGESIGCLRRPRTPPEPGAWRTWGSGSSHGWPVDVQTGVLTARAQARKNALRGGNIATLDQEPYGIGRRFWGSLRNRMPVATCSLRSKVATGLRAQDNEK